MTIGEQIRRFVEDKVPDKKDYVEKLGMSYNSMHKYFTDQRLPGFYVLKRLRSLGMDIHSLLQSEDKIRYDK